MDVVAVMKAWRSGDSNAPHSWKELKGRNMFGTNDREVASIQCRDRTHTKSLGERHQVAIIFVDVRVQRTGVDDHAICEPLLE